MAKHFKERQMPKLNESKQTPKQVLQHLWKWAVAAILLAVLLLNLFSHVFHVVQYNGTGMEPELTGGQLLVIQKVKKVQSGDVIAFYYNNQILVRRVIGMGGQQIEIDEHGAVSIGGVPLKEPYLKNQTLGQCNISFPFFVPSGTVFVMGDNRLEAMDSRLKEIGTVSEDRIIGKVILNF